MSIEAVPTKEQREKICDEIWESTPKNGEFIELPEGLSKEDFLSFLVNKKGLLLHGSNNEIETLEPRQGNCSEKKFGNQRAVYATDDEILPMFYAIQDRTMIRGTVQSGFSGDRDSDGKFLSKKYRFAMGQETLTKQPWSNGIIYILSPESFEQGTNDAGEPISEHASLIPVRPLARLKVHPHDFPYLDKIEILQKP